MRRTTVHSTAPRLWWAMKLETEVKTMLAMEVPRARCMMSSLGRFCSSMQNTSMGTMTSPPPMPSRPASTPAMAPTTKYKASTSNMVPPGGDRDVARSPEIGRTNF